MHVDQDKALTGDCCLKHQVPVSLGSKLNVRAASLLTAAESKGDANKAAANCPRAFWYARKAVGTACSAAFKACKS